ncbi:SDR family NAD(P)-dependent oxidoreductase [Labedaea rhizosphaerae]|uniref:Short-subunit dehydrogenase n=1 Tax=Labedaea rhizosphaerae TaxID=598644 RepID=A0A4R6SAG5_LABRH|nr:SDR family NAD(P)-dependent oxidoreductase [Labedaea rhizosphaerae]TDP96524.1 short-subunit dehydrogenase [Labedaea rhizosphaerae]
MRTDMAGRRVLITGAARGIGAALARRLHERGARLALVGLEPDELAKVAIDCGDAPWRECDVSDAAALSAAVDELAQQLGGLDVVVANAGIARQWSLLHGDPAILATTLRVNTMGVCHTIQAATRHVNHPGGYLLVVSSLAAAVHLPLLGAYSASKAAAEALGDTARIELRPSGARVGVAYFAELDTDMTARGFDTDASRAFFGPSGVRGGVTPLSVAIDKVESGIARRATRICVPRWVRPVLWARIPAQFAIGLRSRGRKLHEMLKIARTEEVPFTTEQPEQPERPARD